MVLEQRQNSIHRIPYFSVRHVKALTIEFKAILTVPLYNKEKKIFTGINPDYPCGGVDY